MLTCKVNVDIKFVKSIICHQNRVVKALLRGAYDARAIRAALHHFNADLFNVNLYMLYVQNENDKESLCFSDNFSPS